MLVVTFSPDGSRMVSAGADGIVKVWDRQSLRAILTLRGHAAAVTVLAFSADGRRLASGSADGWVRIWDTASGETLVKWQCHAGGVTGLAFEPEGGLASTGRGKAAWGELKLWDAAKGEILASQTWRNLLAAVAFSPDGRYLVTAGHDGFVLLWEADDDRIKRPACFKAQNERIIPWTSVAFSGDGQRVAAGSSAGVVRVWTKAKQQMKKQQRGLAGDPGGVFQEWTGVNVQEFVTTAQSAVSGVAFSGPDGRILAAACADNTLQGWITKTGKPAFTFRGHREAVTSVACSPDGACLLSGSRDRTVKLWDIRRRDDDLTLRASKGYTSLAFSPANDYLASASCDKAVLIWDMTTGMKRIPWQRLPESINGLAFSAMAFNSPVPATMGQSASARCRLGVSCSTHVVIVVPFMPWLSAWAAIVSLPPARTGRFEFGTPR